MDKLVDIPTHFVFQPQLPKLACSLVKYVATGISIQQEVIVKKLLF